MNKLLNDSIGRICCLIIISLYTLVLMSDFIAPYNPNSRDTKSSYMSPSKIHFFYNGKLSQPFIYDINTSFNPETLLNEVKENKSKRYFINFFIRGEEYSFFKFFKHNIHLFGINDVNHRVYLFGTDRNGRDIFSRLLHGGKPSLTIGFVGLLIVFPLGLLYGGISGYFGGITDNLMMRFTEALMSLPFFYLIVVLASILPASLSNSERFLLITVILSFVSWAGLSRVIRGLVLSIREQEFIQSSKAIGENDFNIITKHVLPQTTSYVIIAITLSIPGFIIGESALSFLGLGITQPDPSWGNLLAEGKELSNMLIRPWILLLPAFCIFISVLSFNILGDKIRDLLDPRG